MSGASGRRSGSRVAMCVLALLSGSALIAVGCGSPSMFGPPPDGVGGSTGNGVFPSGTGAGATGDPCSPEGAEKPCHVVIGSHDGVTSCLDGVQVCFQGKWNVCSQATLSPSAHRGPILPGRQTALLPPVDDASGPTSLPVELLTTMGSCSDHCDPTCQQFTETSPAGGMPMGTGAGSWVQAPRSALTGDMGAIMGQGYMQPCGAAWDCEFGQYCSNPVTQNMPGSCAHDKCAAGSGLAGCNDPCVQAVLADPLYAPATCCGPTPASRPCTRCAGKTASTPRPGALTTSASPAGRSRISATTRTRVCRACTRSATRPASPPAAASSGNGTRPAWTASPPRAA